MRPFVSIFFVLTIYFGMPIFVNAASFGPTDNAFDTTGSSFGQTENTIPSQTPGGSNEKLINPLKGGGNLQSFLLNILDFIINIGSIIVILMLVFVGFKFVTAQGEPGKISEAREMLLWTVIGALVLLGSKAIALGVDATVKALSGGS